MNIMEGNFFDTFISRHFDLYSQDIYGRRGSGVDQYFVENYFFTEYGHKDVERAYTGYHLN